MRYAFLIDTYATEREKVLTVWSGFTEAELDLRPRPDDPRGRTAREHFQHQCASEHGWFSGMFGIDAGPALPAERTRAAYVAHYAARSAERLARLAAMDDQWWETAAAFFGEPRPRTWIMVRRIAHTAHHRGQQTMLLRQFGRPLHSTYGPTADTGGLAANGGRVIYAYPTVDALLAGGPPTPLPGPGAQAPTELG